MLSDLISRELTEQRMTVEDVVRRSRNRISTAYLRKIQNGTARNLSVEMAEALSIGLGVPLIEVVNAALKYSLSTPQAPLSRLLAIYETLHESQQAQINPFIEVLCREALRILDENQRQPTLPRELS